MSNNKKENLVLLDINNLQRRTTDHHLRLSISHPNQTEIITQINRISLSDYNYKVLYQNSRIPTVRALNTTRVASS